MDLDHTGRLTKQLRRRAFRRLGADFREGTVVLEKVEHFTGLDHLQQTAKVRLHFLNVDLFHRQLLWVHSKRPRLERSSADWVRSGFSGRNGGQRRPAWYLAWRVEGGWFAETAVLF